MCDSPAFDTATASVVSGEGEAVGDIAIYRCIPGYKVKGVESVVYNITCTRVAKTLTAVWSEQPELEGQ